MKKYLLFFGILMLSTDLIAQDYLPVPVGQTSYYQTAYFHSAFQGNECADGDCLLGIQVTNVLTGGGDVDYFFNKGVRGNNGFCTDGSWLGPQAQVLPNGDQVYLNSENNPILLKPTANLGESWQLISFQDNSFIEGTLESVYEEMIFGLIDTIAQIQMVKKDMQGNVIDDALNNKSILMAKNSGFLETYDFYRFPEDAESKYLVGYRGINGSTEGLVTPTAAEVFNYDIGNEYHYETSEDNQWGGPPYYSEHGFERIIVLDKTVSASSDTFTYTMDKTVYNELIENGTTVVTTSRDTIVTDVILERYEYLNAIPHAPIDYTIYYEGYISPYVADGRVITRAYDYIYHDADMGCFYPFVGTGWFFESFYSGCLGQVRLEDTGGSKWERMVYYQKGNEEWGEPVDFDSLLNATDEIFLSEETFKVHPNPTANYLNISSDDFQNEELLIELFSLDGRQVLAQESLFNGQVHLEIPEMVSGLSVLKISTAKGIYVEKIVVLE